MKNVLIIFVAFHATGVAVEQGIANSPDCTVKLRCDSVLITSGEAWNIEVGYRQNSGYIEAWNPYLTDCERFGANIQLLDSNEKIILSLVSSADCSNGAFQADSYLIRSGEYVGHRFTFQIKRGGVPRKVGDPFSGDCILYLPEGDFTIQAVYNASFVKNSASYMNIDEIARSPLVEFAVDHDRSPKKQSNPHIARVECELAIKSDRKAFLRKERFTVCHRLVNSAQKNAWIYNPFLCELANPLGMRIVAIDQKTGKKWTLKSGRSGSKVPGPICYVSLPPGGVCEVCVRLNAPRRVGQYSLVALYEDKYFSDPPQLPKPGRLKTFAELASCIEDWALKNPGKVVHRSQGRTFKVADNIDLLN